MGLQILNFLLVQITWRFQIKEQCTLKIFKVVLMLKYSLILILAMKCRILKHDPCSLQLNKDRCKFQDEENHLSLCNILCRSSQHLNWNYISLQDSQDVSWNWDSFVVFQIWKLITSTKPNQIDHVNTFSYIHQKELSMLYQAL